VTESDRLILFGHDTVARLAVAIEDGANLLHCQLLACDFYDAVRQAWADTPAREFVRSGLLGAAVAQLRSAAERSPSPLRMLDGIRAAIAMIETGAQRAAAPAEPAPVANEAEPVADAVGPSDATHAVIAERTETPARRRLPFRVIDGGLSSRALSA
jgi:hypothetical protein